MSLMTASPFQNCTQGRIHKISICHYQASVTLLYLAWLSWLNILIWKKPIIWYFQSSFFLVFCISALNVLHWNKPFHCMLGISLQCTEIKSASLWFLTNAAFVKSINVRCLRNFSKQTQNVEDLWRRRKENEQLYKLLSLPIFSCYSWRSAGWFVKIKTFAVQIKTKLIQTSAFDILNDCHKSLPLKNAKSSLELRAD